MKIWPRKSHSFPHSFTCLTYPMWFFGAWRGRENRALALTHGSWQLRGFIRYISAPQTLCRTAGYLHYCPSRHLQTSSSEDESLLYTCAATATCNRMPQAICQISSAGMYYNMLREYACTYRRWVGRGGLRRDCLPRHRWHPRGPGTTHNHQTCPQPSHCGGECVHTHADAGAPAS